MHISADLHRRRHLHTSRVAADFYSCFRLERSLRSLSVFFSIWSFVARIVLIESSKGIWAVVSCYSLIAVIVTGIRTCHCAVDLLLVELPFL